MLHYTKSEPKGPTKSQKGYSVAVLLLLSRKKSHLSPSFFLGFSLNWCRVISLEKNIIIIYIVCLSFIHYVYFTKLDYQHHLIFVKQVRGVVMEKWVFKARSNICINYRSRTIVGQQLLLWLLSTLRTLSHRHHQRFFFLMFKK